MYLEAENITDKEIVYEIKGCSEDLFDYTLLMNSGTVLYEEFSKFVCDEINYKDEKTGEYTGTLHGIIKDMHELTYEIAYKYLMSNYTNEMIKSLGYDFIWEDIQEAIGKCGLIIIPETYTLKVVDGSGVKASIDGPHSITYKEKQCNLFYVKKRVELIKAVDSPLKLTIKCIKLG